MQQDKIIEAHIIFHDTTGIEISPAVDRALKKILPMFEKGECSNCRKMRELINEFTNLADKLLCQKTKK